MTYYKLPTKYQGIQLHLISGVTGSGKSMCADYVTSIDSNTTCIRLKELIDKHEDSEINLFKEHTISAYAADLLLKWEIERIAEKNTNAVILLDGCIKNTKQFKLFLSFFEPIIKSVIQLSVSEDVYMQRAMNALYQESVLDTACLDTNLKSSICIESLEELLKRMDDTYLSKQRGFRIYNNYLKEIEKICYKKEISFIRLDANKDIEDVKKDFVHLYCSK